MKSHTLPRSSILSRWAAWSWACLLASPAAAQDLPGLFVRPNSWVRLHLDPSPEPAVRDYNFRGQGSWSFVYPVAGDFDDSGTDSIGFFDRRTMYFRVHTTNEPVEPSINQKFVPSVYFLRNPDVAMFPVVGDWNGDGYDTVGLLDPGGGHAVSQ